MTSNAPMKSEETAELEAYVPRTDELAEDDVRVTVLGSGDPWVRPGIKPSACHPVGAPIRL